MNKVVRLSEIMTSRDWGKVSEGVCCFGHFNAIHPGHIRYFRTARQHGTPLVVAVEGDAQLSHPNRRHVFPEEERALSVASLDLVDYVIVLDTGTLDDFVRYSRIPILVLGKEFEGARAGKARLAISSIQSHGGQVFYDAGETHYASAELFSTTPGDLENAKWDAFVRAKKSQEVSLQEMFSQMDRAGSPNILVVGDTIVDRYVACDPVGMSNEAPVVVVKEMQTQDYAGGAAIVAAHVTALGANCTYLSVIGDDDAGEYARTALDSYDVASILIEDNSRPTTFKLRYLVENQKLFRVSRLKEHSVSGRIEDQLIREIQNIGPEVDGILVSDFVYGVVTGRVLDTIIEVSRQNEIPLFGDLQCSSQVGSILKFGGFHLICPTEREARIALSNHDDGIEYISNLIIEKTESDNLILKMGADGFITYSRQEDGEMFARQHFPALTVNPVDVTGAGDALIAALTVGVTQGFSLMPSSGSRLLRGSYSSSNSGKSAH